MDWERAGYMDIDQDGDVDINDAVLWEEILDKDNLSEGEDSDKEYDFLMADIDPDYFCDMDEDELLEVLEDAGLELDDYDF